MLRNILVKKMDVSQAPFPRDGLAHFRKEKRGHTYDFLMGSMERFINDHTLEQNSAIQAAEYGRSSTSSVSKKAGKGDHEGGEGCGSGYLEGKVEVFPIPERWH